MHGGRSGGIGFGDAGSATANYPAQRKQKWSRMDRTRFNWRNSRWNAESAATSLVNGVRDDQLIPDAAFLAAGSGREQLYRTAQQLRARRLDMFADGLQDWIGLSEANLFGGQHKPEGLKGQCRVAALVQCDNGAPAARVFGQASKHGQSIPKTLVIVDPTGVIRGVARSSAPVSPLLIARFT